jgi:hypothetical protein
LKKHHSINSADNFFSNNFTQKLKNQNFANYLRSSKDPELLREISAQLINNTLSNVEMRNRKNKSMLNQPMFENVEEDPLQMITSCAQINPKLSSERQSKTTNQQIPTFGSNQNKDLKENPETNSSANYLNVKSEKNMNIPNHFNFSNKMKNYKHSNTEKNNMNNNKNPSLMQSLGPIYENITSVNPNQRKMNYHSQQNNFFKSSENLVLPKISSKYESNSIISSEMNPYCKLKEKYENKKDNILYTNQNLSTSENKEHLGKNFGLREDSHNLIPFTQLDFENFEKLCKSRNLNPNVIKSIYELNSQKIIENGQEEEHLKRLLSKKNDFEFQEQSFTNQQRNIRDHFDKEI